jgi:putative transposase
VLDRTLNLNQAHLRAVVVECQEHYNTARRYQGLGHHVPDDGISPRVTAANSGSWQIRRKPVLSGLINEYERAASGSERPRSKPESYFRAAQHNHARHEYE